MEPDPVNAGVGKVYEAASSALFILSLIFGIKSVVRSHENLMIFSGLGGLMKFHLNGETIESTAGTLMELVLEQGFDPAFLIAEVNFKLIPQASWDIVPVRPGDTIELLSFVGGG